MDRRPDKDMVFVLYGLPNARSRYVVELRWSQNHQGSGNPIRAIASYRSATLVVSRWLPRK